jgi:hypothetical protein
MRDELILLVQSGARTDRPVVFLKNIYLCRLKIKMKCTR